MQRLVVPWKDADVHAWSTKMAQVISETMPALPAESARAGARCDPAAIRSALGRDVWAVVDKIAGRRSCGDLDLCGMDPLGLLQLLWEEMDARDAGDIAALEDLLRDIGHTCLQGDTHRLFSRLLAIRRSTNKAI